jgi:hypothetical protein
VDKHKQNGSTVDETPSLRVEKGEKVTLAFESQRFKGSFRKVRPRSANEVRQLVGLSDGMAQTLRERGVCRHEASPAAIVSADELDSSDKSVRGRALAITEKALYDYLYAVSAAPLAQMESAIGRYLEIADVVLNVAVLQDIEVADGATLTIPANTHVVEANKIILHGSAQIDCVALTKFRVKSIEKA